MRPVIEIYYPSYFKAEAHVVAQLDGALQKLPTERGNATTYILALRASERLIELRGIPSQHRRASMLQMADF